MNYREYGVLRFLSSFAPLSSSPGSSAGSRPGARYYREVRTGTRGAPNTAGPRCRGAPRVTAANSIWTRRKARCCWPRLLTSADRKDKGDECSRYSRALMEAAERVHRWRARGDPRVETESRPARLRVGRLPCRAAETSSRCCSRNDGFCNGRALARNGPGFETATGTAPSAPAESVHPRPYVRDSWLRCP